MTNALDELFTIIEHYYPDSVQLESTRLLAAAELAQLRAEIKLQYDMAENNNKCFERVLESANVLQAALDEAVAWHEGEDSPHAQLEQQISELRKTAEEWKKDACALWKFSAHSWDCIITPADHRCNCGYSEIRESHQKLIGGEK